ncbi:MAG: DUF721 domain-containing protein [Patescibacteria group bacterium]|jgi:hypothetical protein
MAFTSLGHILKKNIRAAGIEPQVQGAQIVEKFNVIAKDILGEEVASRIKPMYVKNKTLTVAVGSSVLGQEIKLNEHEILKRINVDRGPLLVERIRFLV